ncbi:hypothetical protein IPJ72_05060 [Candidatus Peregrinibacteria bacterium]|nr:MAG: hypothetical protein IPJ72_05060 [Candidatus Peregrinibacteria bacterium]
METFRYLTSTEAPAAVGPYSLGLVPNKPGQERTYTFESSNPDIATATAEILEQIKKQIDLSRVAMVKVGLPDISGYPAMNAKYAEVFSDHKPARLALAPEQGDLTMQVIVWDDTNAGDESDSVPVYLSGQVGLNPKSERPALVEGGLEAEMRQTIQNIRAALLAAELGLASVHTLQVYIPKSVNRADAEAALNEAWGDQTPTVEWEVVNQLPLSAQVEIVAKANKPIGQKLD